VPGHIIIGFDHTGDNFLSSRKRALPVVPPKEVDLLADRWLKRVKSNPLIAALIVLGTVFAVRDRILANGRGFL
jgi:hypothetical protein